MNFAAPLEGNSSLPTHLSSFLVQIATAFQQLIQSLHVFNHHSPPAGQHLGDLIILTDIIVRDADGQDIARTETSISTGALAGHLLRTPSPEKPREQPVDRPRRNYFPSQSPSFRFLVLSTRPPSLVDRFITLFNQIIIHLHPSPHFVFTIDKSTHDPVERYPGIITGQNFRLSVNGTTYHVAIHTPLMQIHGWSLLKCYVNNSRPHTLLKRRQGFIFVDNRLIHGAFCHLSDVPEYDKVPRKIAKKWQAVPKDCRLSATALLPEDLPLPLMSVVDFAPPDIFKETDVQE